MDMRIWFNLVLLFCFAMPVLAENESAPISVVLSPDSGPVHLNGYVKGYQYIDYRLQAAAGQRLEASMDANNLASYFNILPPQSQDEAMFIGSSSGNRYEGLLPDDGIYTLRVYLMRSAARRNEVSEYTLSVNLSGAPLLPLTDDQDAMISGTRYHAVAIIPCKPVYSDVRNCEAKVVRRDFAGTATVVLSWGEQGGRRRILFIKGKPVVADLPQPLTYSANEQGDYVVEFNGADRFEIPQSLIFGD